MSVNIVGIGGSIDSGSQSEAALRAVLDRCRERGASVRSFSGAALNFPPYYTGADTSAAAEYIEAVRAADAVVIASPGYHGTVSGLVKNALDYLEELRTDTRPYLDGRAVGLVAVARGWQAAVSTLGTLRQITHALRGWPTPFGMSVNSAVVRFDADGGTTDPSTAQGLDILAGQLVDFASRMGTSDVPTGGQP